MARLLCGGSGREKVPAGEQGELHVHLKMPSAHVLFHTLDGLVLSEDDIERIITV